MRVVAISLQYDVPALRLPLRPPVSSCFCMSLVVRGTEVGPAGRGDPTSGLASCQDTMLNRSGVSPADPFSFVLLVHVLFLAAFTWLALKLLCRPRNAAGAPPHAHPPPSRRARGRSSHLRRSMYRSQRRVVRGARRTWAGFGACGAAAALFLTLCTHTAQAATCPPDITPVRA